MFVCMWARIFNFSVQPDFSSETVVKIKRIHFLFKFSMQTQPYFFKSALTLTEDLNKVLFLGMVVFYGNKSIFVQF